MEDRTDDATSEPTKKQTLIVERNMHTLSTKLHRVEYSFRSKCGLAKDDPEYVTTCVLLNALGKEYHPPQSDSLKKLFKSTANVSKELKRSSREYNNHVERHINRAMCQTQKAMAKGRFMHVSSSTKKLIRLLTVRKMERTHLQRLLSRAFVCVIEKPFDPNGTFEEYIIKRGEATRMSKPTVELLLDCMVESGVAK